MRLTKNVIAMFVLASVIAGGLLQASVSRASACTCGTYHHNSAEELKKAVDSAEAVSAGEVISTKTHKVQMFSNEREDIIKFSVN